MMIMWSGLFVPLFSCAALEEETRQKGYSKRISEIFAPSIGDLGSLDLVAAPENASKSNEITTLAIVSRLTRQDSNIIA